MSFDINSIGGSNRPTGNAGNDKVSANKEAERKQAQKADDAKRKREDEIMNPVDRSMISQQTGLGSQIALSMLMGSIS